MFTQNEEIRVQPRKMEVLPHGERELHSAWEPKNRQENWKLAKEVYSEGRVRCAPMNH